MKPLSSVLSTLLLAGLAFIGCDGSNDPDEPAFVVPKLGSSFIYLLNDTDVNGVIVPGTDSTQVATVTAVDVSYAGRSGLVKIQQGADFAYLQHEENGDVWMLLDLTIPLSDVELGSPIPLPDVKIPQRWIRLPISDKGTYPIEPIDTSITIAIFEVPVQATGTSKYLASEKMQVGEKTYDVHKILVDVQGSGSAQGFPVTFAVIDTLWYAPAIGFMARDAYVQKGTAVAITNGFGLRRQLTSFTRPE